MGPIFDSHAHYTSRQFDADREAVLAGLPALGVTGVCEQSTHSGDAVRAVELAHRYPFVYAAVGIHPESLIEEDAATVAVYRGDWRAELRDLRALYEDERVVAVGECGLDYHWPVPREEQKEMFEEHLRLARELDMPIVVHDREAHADVYALLERYRPKGIVHCFSGSAEDAVRLVRQGMYLGFGGSCTFQGAKRALRALAAVPLESIVLETDCPYLAPTPFRGRRNHSGLIVHVAEVIAREKQLDPETVLRRTEANARRVFGLGPDAR